MSENRQHLAFAEDRAQLRPWMALLWGTRVPSRLVRTFQLGVKSLWLHRLRSLLTVLGIVFGVSSVIAMLAIGEGASYEAQEQIKSLGSQNIMLASVTERTREIGIRRAMGAKRRDIVMQFLVETVLLAAAGGALGVALGIGIPFAVSTFAGMKTIVTIWSPLLAFGISALVGVVFGLYPASRAARMDPVEALRHE